MAATSSSLGNTATSGDKQIPLLCSVCPDSPRFSDVSHLLTHIASKGHLHHETQTKLKAHEDFSAAVALQQYEQWYREYGIETLLVERLRAKQMKEAVRIRRNRTPMTSAQTNKVSMLSVPLRLSDSRTNEKLSLNGLSKIRV